jgi:hypothetical protein
MSILDFLSAPVGGNVSMGQPFPTINRLGLFGAGLQDLGNNMRGVQSDNLRRLQQMALLNAQAQRQNDAYQRTLASLSAQPQLNPVTITPQVTQSPDGTINRAPSSAYDQPAMSQAGPLAGNPMADLLKAMPADQGLPSLISMLGPHKIDTVTDAQGVPHLIDSLTGQDRGTIGGPKPISLNPGQSLVMPDQGTPQPQPLTLPRLASAITQQESGGNPSIGTSVDGAVGPSQILPQTFAQYAKPGESISNPADNQAVQQRILADYAQKFGGDPARVAVAYFSGPNNVAPPGSPTPWVRDVKDGNGKSVSSYVSDVMGRIQQPQQSSGYHTVFAGTPPIRPMTAEELQKYNALPGSTINTATGEVTRATAYNSPAAMDTGTLDGLAAQYNLTGHLPAGMGRGGYAAQQVLARADALVPPEIRNNGPQAIAQWRAQNAQNYVSQGASIKNFDQGKLGNTVRSFSVGLSHIDTLKKAVAALGNGDNQSYNKLKNVISNWTGQPAPNNFDAIRNIVADEISKAIIGGATALGDRDAAKATINNAQSPQQLMGVLSQYEDLMGGQLRGLAQQYKVATGRNDFASRLSPEAQRVFGIGHGQKATPPISPSSLPRKSAGLQRVNSVSDAMKLPPGTHFLDPNGVERIR